MFTRKWRIILSAITIGLTLNYIGLKKAWAHFSFDSPKVQLTKIAKSNRIQVALLLDTSGSMSGLIEQAKSQLWQILNQLSNTTKNGETPTLEIALYEYGNTVRMTDNQQIVKITDFTTDMDLISEKLFALNTSGGDEYCGQVIDFSLNQLEWTAREGDIRMIYIAGNESFFQGPVHPAQACTYAKNKDVIVNTIFCGNQQEGIRLGWQSGAVIGQGTFMNIDHNEATTYIATPYDDKINQLNSELNRTYIPYGRQGEEKKMNQTTQDLNATTYSMSNAADRAAFKSSKSYKAESWDLVDAYKKDKGILKKAKDLPEDLKDLSIEEMEKRIEEAASKRSSIQQEITELNQKRVDFQTKERKEGDSKNLKHSVLESVQMQAKKKGYQIN